MHCVGVFHFTHYSYQACVITTIWKWWRISPMCSIYRLYYTYTNHWCRVLSPYIALTGVRVKSGHCFRYRSGHILSMVCKTTWFRLFMTSRDPHAHHVIHTRITWSTRDLSLRLTQRSEVEYWADIHHMDVVIISCILLFLHINAQIKTGLSTLFITWKKKKVSDRRPRNHKRELESITTLRKVIDTFHLPIKQTIPMAPCQF